MEDLRTRVLNLIKNSPGLTDRQITDALIGTATPQQRVNQTCRLLEDQRRLSRKPRHDGKIGNYWIQTVSQDSGAADHGVDLTGPTQRASIEPPHWSGEIQFEPSAVLQIVPNGAGVYQILQSTEYPRYEGNTRVLKIGKSIKDLCSEIGNHFQRHTVANRLRRVQSRPYVSLTFIFAETSPVSASGHEAELLRSFEDKHWDLPLLNSQRGYGRGSDAHYCETLPVDSN